MAKFESVVFYVFIIAIPFQTRSILKIWGNSFNEWNSAYLYGTDILVLGLFILWLWRVKRQVNRPLFCVGLVADELQKRPIHPSSDKILLIFLAIAALTFSQADSKFLSFYSWLKLLEMIGLYFYVKASLGRTMSIKWLLFAVIASGIFQSLVAIGQSLFQQSLGL